jgi:hypothetical protein
MFPWLVVKCLEGNKFFDSRILIKLSIEEKRHFDWRATYLGTVIQMTRGFGGVINPPFM